MERTVSRSRPVQGAGIGQHPVAGYGIQRPGAKKSWGWQHIATKHGFGASEQAEVRSALGDPMPTLQFPSMNQWVFHHYYEASSGSGGTIYCVRSVGVQFEPDPQQLKLGDSSMKGIVNTYTGRLLSP